MRLLAFNLYFLIIVFGFQNTYPLNLNEAILARQTESYWQTQLLFGRDKNNGTEVSEEEWGKFLNEIVTPRFPKGLTVLDAKGQWRNDDGKIIKENSKLLILLYPIKNRRSYNRKIEEIRKIYKKMFNQYSVMRVDSRQFFVN